MNSMQNLFNLIRVYASKEYQDTVPALKDKSPIGDVMTPILSDLAIYKEFTVLLGAWIRDEVYKEAWSHPIIQDIVKYGNGRPVGNYTREIANNPVNPTVYDPAHPERVLEQKFTNDLVNFYVRNVYDKFKLTFIFDEIEQAFTSYEGAEEYVSMKKASVETGANFATFNHLKECLFANMVNGGVNVITLPATVEAMTDAQWLTVGEQMEAFSKKFTYLNTDYLAYNNLSQKVEDYYGFAKKENVRIIATVDFITKYGYKALANMFNLEIGELKDRVHEIDDFGYPIYNYKSGEIVGYQKSRCAAALLDIKGLKASVDKEQDAELFNPETLSTTIFKHKWQTFALSPFAKCLMFVEPETDSEVMVEQTGVIARANESVVLDYSKSTIEGNFSHVLIPNFEPGNVNPNNGAETTFYSAGRNINSEVITDAFANGDLRDIADDTLVPDGSVVSDTSIALAILFYLTIKDLIAVRRDTSAVVDFDVDNGLTLVGTFGKDVKVDIRRANDVNLLNLDSYTIASDSVAGTKTVTIDSITKERIRELYPRLYASLKLGAARSGSADAAGINGSPVTVNVSPLPSAEW